MKKFQILASTHLTAKDVFAHYESDKWSDEMNTSSPVWIEAGSLEVAINLFIETAIYKDFASKKPIHHFYCNDGNGNLVQCQ